MSTSPSFDLSTAIPCHRCGYDVRAQPSDGGCPECQASVAESRRMALIPIRPAWRDSDPRWRRRMVAGAWVLVFVPLMTALRQFGHTTRTPALTFLAVQGGQTLDDTYVIHVYVCLIFCIGVVLLFSRERGRQRNRFDWTRRWGVIASYSVMLLGMAEILFITALVALGLAALLSSIPTRYQPISPDWFATPGVAYMHFGPQPGRASAGALAACSSIVMLLACAPLVNALRSSGPRVLAGFLLLPLMIASVANLAYVGLFASGLTIGSTMEIYIHPYFLRPGVLARGLAEFNWPYLDRDFIAELLKWFALIAIAVWLSIAQIAAWFHRPKSSAKLISTTTSGVTVG